jgi:hypothetical protein
MGRIQIGEDPEFGMAIFMKPATQYQEISSDAPFN